jgi:hypothetical protein
MATEATRRLIEEREERAVARIQRDLESIEVNEQVIYRYRSEADRTVAGEQAQKAANRLGFTIGLSGTEDYDEAENRKIYLLTVTLLRRPERNVSTATTSTPTPIPALPLGSDEQFDCDQTVFHLTPTTYIWLPRHKFSDCNGALLPNGLLRDDWDYGHGVITLVGTPEAIWKLNVARQKSVLSSVRVGDGISEVSWALKEAAPAQEHDNARNTGSGRRQEPETWDEPGQSL